MSEDRASDNPQPSAIRKSAHIRAFRQGAGSGEDITPIPITPTPNFSYVFGHLARVYDPLQGARRMMIAHQAREGYVMTTATQLMIGHRAVV